MGILTQQRGKHETSCRHFPFAVSLGRTPSSHRFAPYDIRIACPGPRIRVTQLGARLPLAEVSAPRKGLQNFRRLLPPVLRRDPAFLADAVQASGRLFLLLPEDEQTAALAEAAAADPYVFPRLAAKWRDAPAVAIAAAAACAAHVRFVSAQLLTVDLVARCVSLNEGVLLFLPPELRADPRVWSLAWPARVAARVLAAVLAPALPEPGFARRVARFSGASAGRRSRAMVGRGDFANSRRGEGIVAEKVVRGAGVWLRHGRVAEAWWRRHARRTGATWRRGGL